VIAIVPVTAMPYAAPSDSEVLKNANEQEAADAINLLTSGM